MRGNENEDGLKLSLVVHLADVRPVYFCTSELIECWHYGTQQLDGTITITFTVIPLIFGITQKILSFN
jgi:hypothetical protein